MLRALGYPNLVSLESFRKPNFYLVADLLVWLTKRFDNDTDIVLQIDTEDDRVTLIRNVAQFMVKLNYTDLIKKKKKIIKTAIKNKIRRKKNKRRKRNKN